MNKWKNTAFNGIYNKSREEASNRFWEKSVACVRVEIHVEIYSKVWNNVDDRVWDKLRRLL